LIFSLYSFLYRATLSAVFLSEYRKRPTYLRARWLREKRGIVDLPPRSTDAETIWIHAVSVGETLASIPLIKGLLRRQPDLRIVLTTITDTGQRIAEQRLGNSVSIAYMPFDLSTPLNRFLDTIRPQRFLIMETELWPNAIRICHERGIPIALVNGRISERSYHGYTRIRFFMREVLRKIDALCVQNEMYAERLRNLGAPDKNIYPTGNIKFDLVVPDKHLPWTQTLRGRTLLAGSTHNPEEELILAAYRAALRKFPDLKLIITPRHPERFDEVEALIKKSGLSYERSSTLNRLSAEQLNTVSDHQIILMDTMGDLASAYAVADIAIVGGSFIAHGGQNPLEPAYWGKAIICGPHMFNFPFFYELAETGAVRLSSEQALADDIIMLLENPALCAQMGNAARAFLAQNAGATDRTLDIVNAMTSSRSV